MGAYFIFSDNEKIVIEDVVENIDEADQKKATEVNKNPNSQSIINKSDSRSRRASNKQADLSDAEIKKIDDNVAAMEKKWDDRMKSLFTDKLGLSEEDFKDYTVMRDGFEEDRLEAFEKFHQEMAEKHGDSYRYSPTLEMKEFESKIKTEYQDLFRKRFGEEAYANYQNEMESFNDEARKNADPELGVLYIEY